MLTLGVDPGTARCGFGLVAGERDLRAETFGCITTTPRDSLGARLAIIRDALATLFDEHPVTQVALERLGHARTLTSAVQVSHVCGLVHLIAADHGLGVEEYSPPEIKLAVTGHGGADKRAVQTMVQHILGLETPPEPDHASDALAVAVCHVHSREARALERALATR